MRNEIEILNEKEVKKKEVKVGITEELKDFLNAWMEKATEEKEEKNYSNDIKIAIVNIAERELSKIDEELDKGKLEDDKWFRLIDKVEKISDLVRWF